MFPFQKNPVLSRCMLLDVGCGRARRHLPCMQAASTASAALQSLPPLLPPAVSLPQQPAEVPALPEEVVDSDAAQDEDDMFTERDWENVLRGYTSQHREHDFWIPDSMIEGEGLPSWPLSPCILHASHQCW